MRALDDIQSVTQKSLRSMDAPEGREYLVIVPIGWGRDRNAGKATRIAKRHGRHGENLQAVVVDVPEGAWVDQMGTVCWEDPEDTIEAVGKFTYTRNR